MHTTIEFMPLYVHVERIYAELAQLGIGRTDPLRPDQLYPFDQFHYHGVAAVRQAAHRISLSARHRVLDVGSGLGGPARCLTSEFGCRVTALELQPALHEIATDLTARCGLDAAIAHVRGDAQSHALPTAGFDAAVNFMVIIGIAGTRGSRRARASWCFHCSRGLWSTPFSRK